MPSAFQDILVARVNAAREEARKLRIELAKVTRQRDHAREQLEKCGDHRADLARKIVRLEIALDADSVVSALGSR